jgi:hypothetical protein
MAKDSDTDASAPASTDAAPTKAAAPASPTTRFTAPIDTTAIIFSTGRQVNVAEDGTLTAPDDLSDDERLQLTRAGFSAA